MEKLLDRAPLIETVAATMAGTATVFYLLGISIVCNFAILPRCAISDYVRLSVFWLAPIIFIVVILLLLNLAFGKHWWLMIYGPIVVALFVTAIVRPDAQIPSASASPIGVHLVMLIAFVLVGALATLAVKRSPATQRTMIFTFTYAILILIFALSSGVSTGMDLMAATQPTIALHLTGTPVPLRVVVITQLSDELVVRVVPGRTLYAIPRERIELTETLP